MIRLKSRTAVTTAIVETDVFAEAAANEAANSVESTTPENNLVESKYPATTLDWALWCAERSWYVLPCEELGKIPESKLISNGVNSASKDPETIKSWFAQRPNCNYAVAGGDNSDLAFFDYDDLYETDTGVDYPASDYPEIYEAFRVRSGRILKPGQIGGFHLYTRGACTSRALFADAALPLTEKPGVNKSGEPLLNKAGKPISQTFDRYNRLVVNGRVTIGEIRSRGEYVIGPGSNHKSGRPYEIVNDAPLVENPARNTEIVDASPAIGTEEQNMIAGYIESAFEKSGIDFTARTQYQNGFKWLIDCPWEHEHTSGKSIRNGGSSSAVFMASSGALGYRCLHAHCQSTRNWKELREWMEQQVGERLEFRDPSNDLVTVRGVPAGAGSTLPNETTWDEPRPLDNSLLPVEPFKLEFLPTSLQPWAKDVAERMSVPLDFVGVCALAVLAGVVNRRAFVYPKQQDKEWKEALAISGAVIAASGKLKTPTWKTFTNILLEIEYDWRAEFAKRKGVYDSQLKNWKEAEKSRKKDETFVVITDPPKEPAPCRRLMLNDSTPEMMHQIMTENPEGLFIYRDELASWVAELDKEGREVERGLYLSAMNGNDGYAIDRIGRGSVFATMSASLFGGFQPDLLVEFLSDTRNVSDGMIARFGLLCWPDSVVIPRVDRVADEQAKERFRGVIRILAELKAEAIFLHFSGDAQARFNEWYDLHDQKVNREAHTGKQSHLSKYRGLLPKLAGLLQLADIVYSAPSPVGNHLIDLGHLNRAIALLAYLESHMERVYGCIRSPEQRATESLAARIQKGDLTDGFSTRDLKRKHWENLPTSDVTDAALDSLAGMSWLREVETKNPKGGRPTSHWMINPSLRGKKVLALQCSNGSS